MILLEEFNNQHIQQTEQVCGGIIVYEDLQS